jgi:hypothetical protein
MAVSAGLPNQTAFHSALLPALEPDEAALQIIHAEMLHGGRLTYATDAAARTPIGRPSNSLDRRIRRPHYFIGLSGFTSSHPRVKRFTPISPETRFGMRVTELGFVWTLVRSLDDVGNATAAVGIEVCNIEELSG